MVVREDAPRTKHWGSGWQFMLVTGALFGSTGALAMPLLGAKVSFRRGWLAVAYQPSTRSAALYGPAPGQGFGYARHAYPPGIGSERWTLRAGNLVYEVRFDLD
jgi:hypothetical protein